MVLFTPTKLKMVDVGVNESDPLTKQTNLNCALTFTCKVTKYNIKATDLESLGIELTSLLPKRYLRSDI